MTGSSLQIITSAVALGIAYAIGYATDAQLLQSYRVLMGFLSACTVLVTVPFFIVQQHRPGQQLPAGVSMIQAGPLFVILFLKQRHGLISQSNLERDEEYSSLEAVFPLPFCILHAPGE